MTDDEVEAVAAELAKAGGVSWHPGQERGPLKLVIDRYRDRARLAIAALERVRAAKQKSLLVKTRSSSANRAQQPIGSLVRATLSLLEAWSYAVL